jgi:hypothetical protein
MSDIEPTIPSDWWQKGALAVIATLSSIVAFFYKKLEGSNQVAIADLQKNLIKQETKTDQCEKDRLELFRTQVRQETELATLKLEIKELKDKGVA